MNEISYLESVGVPKHRLSRCMSGPDYIRDDGYAYLIRSPTRGVIYISAQDHTITRQHHGEILVFNADTFIVSIPFQLIPFLSPGKVHTLNVPGYKIPVKLAIHRHSLGYTTIALGHEERAQIDEARGAVERKTGISFASIGGFIHQSSLVVGAISGNIPSSATVQIMPTGYIVHCPNCGDRAQLRYLEMAHRVDCKCGCKYVAVRKGIIP